MNFALLALPRSGTTWAANWLMDGALCYHDPLMSFTVEELKKHDPGCEWGISCTGYWLYEMPPCNTVIIERDPKEVNESLKKLHLEEMPEWTIDIFQGLRGVRFPHSGLFDEECAREIFYLLRPNKRFNVERYRLLLDMNVQPDFEKLEMDSSTFSKNVKALCATYNQ